jgi:hydrogenase nickel incorporation protein HypB
LERTLRALAGRARCAVVEGDVQTDRDAQRIAALDVPVVQIVTNGTCHLEARMVQEALAQVPLQAIDLLFVETWATWSARLPTTSANTCAWS